MKSNDSDSCKERKRKIKFTQMIMKTCICLWRKCRKIFTDYFIARKIRY